MRVKYERWINLTFDDTRAPIRAKFLGRGRWTTAYHDPTPGGWVYLFVSVRADGRTDHSKEILSHELLGVVPHDNPHLPIVERFDDIDNSDAFNVYRERYYHKLTAKHREAWKAYKALRLIAEAAWSSNGRVRKLRNPSAAAAEVRAEIIERAEEHEDVPTELVEALRLLSDATENYGNSWCFEFRPANLKVDDVGRLILLDVIYDVEQVERELNQARKRAERSRWAV